MKKQINSLLFGLAAFAVFAAPLQTVSASPTLPKHQFENQWENPVDLSADTKWVLLSQSKGGSNIVRDAFEELEVKDPAKNGLIYIADISAMPGFVTKLFALPKMRDYAFPIALIREEGQIAQLKLDSYNKEKVVLLQLDNLTVAATTEFADKAELVKQLKANVMK